MVKKTAYLGMISAIAIIFGYVEAMIPIFTGIPGIKLGLANLVIVFLLFEYTWKDAAIVSVIRILVIGFLFGNLFSILFSLAGAFLSLAVMFLLKKTKQFSIIGISMAGGVTHNLGQILVAAIVVENINLFYYFPALLVSGLITGFLIGILAEEMRKRFGGKKELL